MAERQREKDVARARLARLVLETPAVGEQIEAALHTFNGEPGRPESFNELHELLESQPYRLSYWRTASHEINYRRFFDVNTLAGLRVERPEVFAATHKLLETLLQRRDDRRRPHRSSGRAVRPGALLRDAPGACRTRLARRTLQGGRTATTAAVRCRREDRLRPGSAAAPLGRSRHDGLQLSERSQRPLREQCARPTHAPHVREAHRTTRAVRGRRLREQAA